MKRIFLLEDDTALGQGIRFALENDGIRVELCATLSQAQSILPGADFDLLILDVNLPDGSGLDLLRDVRRCHSGVPVILLTVNDLETDIVVGLESGADDYITTPFSADTGGNPGPCSVPRDAAGTGVAGRRGVRGGKRPVGHRQAPAGQAGGHALQALLSENGLWHRLYLGGELT